MHANRFDTITKDWISLPRRRLLTGVAGSALGALAVTLGLGEAEATHFTCRHVGKRCKRASQCCSGICKRHTCRAHDKGICKASQDACVTSPVGCGGDSAGNCTCVVTTGKASFCGLDGGTLSGCTRDEECVADKGEGAACIQCGEGRLCMARCPTPN